MVARNTIYEFLIHSGLMMSTSSNRKQHVTSQLSRPANLQRGDMTYVSLHRSLPVPITSVPIISGYVHFANLDYGDCDLSIHLSVNLVFSNTADKSSLNISKLHKKNDVITLCVITLCEVIITLCVKCVTLCGYKMYYIMRKSYYVMHKLLRYAKNVLRYAVIITLCGNYYVMRRHTRSCLEFIDATQRHGEMTDTKPIWSNNSLWIWIATSAL